MRLRLYLWHGVSICIDISFTYIMTFYPVTWILLIISSAYTIVLPISVIFLGKVFPFTRFVLRNNFKGTVKLSRIKNVFLRGTSSTKYRVRTIPYTCYTPFMVTHVHNGGALLGPALVVLCK